jgi:hypothetical protein
MKTKMVLLAGMTAAILAGMSASAQQPVSPVNAAIPDMPTKTTRTGKHVNRVIDMWLKNQPVYYAQISGGGYEEGKKMAATKADYITYEMEHGPLDFRNCGTSCAAWWKAARRAPVTRPQRLSLPYLFPAPRTPCAPTRG